MLRRSASRYGAKKAIICGSVEWTYSEFHSLTERIAAGLARRGIGRGDRVAILARNSHAFMALRFGAARLGAVLVPVNFMLKPGEVNYILEHSGARMLCVDASTAEVGLEALPPNVETVVAMAGE